MSQHFIDARDTLPVWDSLKNSATSRSKNNLLNSADYAFITPTIIGDFWYLRCFTWTQSAIHTILHWHRSDCMSSVFMIHLLCKIDCVCLDTVCRSIFFLPKLCEYKSRLSSLRAMSPLNIYRSVFYFSWEAIRNENQWAGWCPWGESSSHMESQVH